MKWLPVLLRPFTARTTEIIYGTWALIGITSFHLRFIIRKAVVYLNISCYIVFLSKPDTNWKLSRPAGLQKHDGDFLKWKSVKEEKECKIFMKKKKWKMFVEIEFLLFKFIFASTMFVSSFFSFRTILETSNSLNIK